MTATDRTCEPTPLSAMLDGPPLVTLLCDRYGITPYAAERAARTITAALRGGWRASGYGSSYEEWLAGVPAPLLNCLLYLAAHSEAEPYVAGHELRTARLMFAQLAVEIGDH
jgi:hypothetical protein